MSEHKEEWEAQAITLANTGVMSWRDISKQLKKSKSTVSDYLRKYYSAMDVGFVKDEHPFAISSDMYEKIANNPAFTWEGAYKAFAHVGKEKEPITHLFIPDSQVKPGVDLSYLDWIGKYIVRKKPDVIVHAGDFADMSSLSQWDKGKKAAEGKRIEEDIKSVREALERLLKPLRELQAQQRKDRETVYTPRLVITLGNHCDRITRYVEANPEFEGFLSIDSLGFKENGFEVVPFLTPIDIDGVNYCHYYPNVMTGKALAGTAAHMLKTIGKSFVMGHRQTLDVATRFLPTNSEQQWGIVCGACYTHEESYKGVQGNKHYRGLIVMHNVKNGSFDPMFVSLDWLKDEYGSNR